MAFMECAECGESISTDAQTCPKCGYRVGKERIRVWQSVLIQVVALVIAILLWRNVGWISALFAYVVIFWLGTKVFAKKNIA